MGGTATGPLAAFADEAPRPPETRRGARVWLDWIFLGSHAHDRRQRTRVFRFQLALGSSLLVLGLFSIGTVFDFLPRRALLLGSAFVMANMVLFFVLFRSGLNLRFAEPSLTFAQIMAAVLAISYFLYFAGEARPIYCMIYTVAFLFGVFQFGTAKQLQIALVMSLCYGSVVVLLFVNQPQSVSPRLELLRFLVLSAALA